MIPSASRRVGDRAGVVKWAALDPVGAGTREIVGDFGTATDYGPDGHAARAALIRTTLHELAGLPVTSETDRRAADHLRERLEAEDAWHASGDPRGARRRLRPGPGGR